MSHLVYRQLAKALNAEEKVEELNPDVLKARDSFAYFCEYLTRKLPEDQQKKPAEHHLEWHNELVTGQDSKCLLKIAGERTNILSPRGSAKAQPLTEPILTPKGWKTMGNIKVGDKVITQHGKPTKITHVTPQGSKAVYKVTFTDETWTECCDDHLWKVRANGTQQYNVYSLHELKEKGIKTKAGFAKYHIPVCNAVQYGNKDLPIHPYLLGALLGDGYVNGSITLTSADDDLIKRVREVLPEGHTIEYKQRYDYKILGSDNRNEITRAWIKLGLKKCTSVNKFIPEIYKYGSIDQRLELLCGLMDTDGTVGSRGRCGEISYCTISPKLKDDIRDIVNSLGGTATFNKPVYKTYTNKHSEKVKGQLTYIIGIRLPEHITPFCISRKKNKYKPCLTRKVTRGIKTIEYVGDKETQCITVKDKSQTYLTRNYIVTHNSTVLGLFVAWIIGVHTTAKKPLNILYISSNGDMANAKSDAIKRTITADEYKEIFPMVRKGKKWGTSLWTIDFDYAGINSVGEDNFTLLATGIQGTIVSKRCVCADTLISTPNGQVKVQDLKIDDDIYSVKDNKIQCSKLVSLETSNKNYIIIIHTQSGIELQCTFDHPIWTVEKGYLYAHKTLNKTITLIHNDELITDTVEYIWWDVFTKEYTVYDIQVEPNNNFFANNILCHNSHLIVMDDLIKNTGEIENPEVRKKMITNWFTAIQPTLFEGGRILSIGTRFAANDIHATTFTEDNSWRVIEQNAIIYDEKTQRERSYWESMWSLDYLKKLRKENPVGFSFQYQNKIARIDEISISEEWIQYTSHLPEQFDQIAIGGDLASSEREKADYTVFTVVGVANGRFYCLDYIRERIMGNVDKILRIQELYEDYGDNDTPFYLFFEKNAYQNSLKGDWDYYVSHQQELDTMHKTNSELHLTDIVAIGLTTKKDKMMNLKDITGKFQNKLVFWNNIVNWEHHVHELTNFGSTEHDDCLDSVIIALRGLGRYRPLSSSD